MTALGPFFVSCAVRYLPSKWKNDPAVHDSWIRLFVVMTELMKRGTGEAVVTELVMEEKVHVLKRLLDVVCFMINVALSSLFCGFYKSRIRGKSGQEQGEKILRSPVDSDGFSKLLNCE